MILVTGATGNAGSAASTAGVHGPLWGARARDWAEASAGVSAPAWEAVAAAAGVTAGTHVLDVGCGSGEFCALAGARGARAAGIDASAAMIEIARLRAPGADLRVGPVEALPWPDATFDVVTGFNVFQFAADPAGALTEAARVVRPGGRVAVCTWAAPEPSEIPAVVAGLRDLLPPPPPGPRADPLALGRRDVLERLFAGAGLETVAEDLVEVPLEAPSLEAMLRALTAPGVMQPLIDSLGESVVRAGLEDALEPHRRPGGGYRLENRFRYAVGTARPA